MDSWIDNYVGEWRDEMGNRLSIRKMTDETARVTFLGAPGEAPIARPWYGGRPSADMPARYYPAHGPELVVDLWEAGRDFTLELCYEGEYPLRAGPIEVLTVGVSRRPRDTFLEEHSRLLGPMTHFARIHPRRRTRR